MTTRSAYGNHEDPQPTPARSIPGWRPIVRHFALALLAICAFVACGDTAPDEDNDARQDGAGVCGALTIPSVAASGNDGNVPANVLDNNLGTRWSSLGKGQFITADLGATTNVCSASIAWYLGNARKNTFTISLSTDGTAFTQAFSGTSSGTTNATETYDFPDASARYVRVTVNGNTQNDWASITELDVMGGTASGQPETLFGATAPAAGDATDSDASAIEVGVEFQASTAGQINSVRFYRAKANAAGYSVHLWSGAGALLATASGNDAGLPGWREIAFSSPVSISANTTYVASYFTSNGGYAGTNGGFASAKTSGHLTAPVSAGVYHYGSAPAFPASTYQSSNYWVDISFVPSGGGGGGDTTAPSVAITSPTSGATVSGTVNVTGTASDNAGVATVAVQVDGGAFAAASGTSAWSYAWNTSGLANGSHTVTARATDTSGNTKTTSVGVTVSGAAPGTCDRTATNASTFASQFSAASAGQTICLASGDYGTWSGGNKAVTIRPQTGATVTMALQFGTGDGGFTIDGLTIPDANVSGDSSNYSNPNNPKNITIENSTFTGPINFEYLANSNILLDHNTHNNIMTCSSCRPARIHLSYSGTTHSGVTIQNSLMDGGNSDGVQTGTGVNIFDNELRNIHETGPDDPAHTDPIQLLGAKGSVVRGNYIHHCADGIVAYDGVDHALIENNVVDLVNGRWGIELYSDSGSIVRHNTLRYATTCEYAPCGMIILDHKSADPAGQGTVIENNIATEISKNSGSSTASDTHNMLRSNAGPSDSIGTPVFVGGANPSTYAGFRLAAGSPGKGAASDGKDVGIP